MDTVYWPTDWPFDVLCGLGYKESLNARLEFQLVTRVDGQTAVVCVGLASFNGDQQQFETDEAQPDSNRHICSHHGYIETGCKNYSFKGFP